MRPDDFETRFLEICEAHRAQGRALAFAFLLFDLRQPHLRHALADGAYWDALDSLSGRTLTVFAFDLPHLARRVAEPEAAYLVREMTAVEWARPEEATEAVRRYFPVLTRFDLPCVLFFQVESARVTDSFAIGLGRHHDGIEAAFNELNDVLGKAVAALAQVEDENARNAREILALVRSEMETRNQLQRGLRIFRGVQKASAAVGLAKALLSLI